MSDERTAVRDAYIVAAVSLPILFIYAVAQTGVSVSVGPERPDLKLVIEPYLLLLGVILHVQWRRVTRTLAEQEVPRPLWIAGCDMTSFVITFWALASLAEAALQQAKVI